MKRSILIAICDFLILSALSLSTGFKTSPADVAPISSEGLNSRKDITAVDSLEYFETGLWDKYNISQEQLKLISAERSIASLQIKLGAREKQLAEKEEQIGNLDKNVKSLEKEQVSLKKDILEKGAEITKQKDHISELNLKEKQLQGELGKSSESLKSATESMRLMLHDKERLNKRIKNQRDKIDELAKKGDAKSQQKLSTQIVELKKMLTENKQLEDRMKKDAVELAVLKKSNEMLAAERESLKQMLNTKERQISDLQKSLTKMGSRSEKFEVWDKFSGAIKKIQIQMQHKDDINKRYFDTTYYLPVVDFDAKQYLISNFSSLGLGWSDIAEQSITELKVNISNKDEKGGKRILGAIQSLNANPAVCLLPFKAQQAIKPIGKKALIDRGVQNLFLLKKNGTNGKIECYFSEKYPDYIFTRSKDRDFYSKPGDYLFTQEGDFIGVFTSFKSCYILPTSLKGFPTTPIPIMKKKNETVYKSFIKAALELKKRVH